MNTTRQRLFLYIALAFIAAVMPELADVKNFADLTPLEWLKVAIGGTGSGLVAWRAFIDQHISRETKPLDLKP